MTENCVCREKGKSGNAAAWRHAKRGSRIFDSGFGIGDCTNECSCGKIFIYMLPVAGEVGKERLRPDLTGSGNMKGEQDEQL